MHLRIDRDISNEETTLSKVYLDDRLFCYGLEDQYQESKIKHETRIPAGTYNIKLRTEGTLTKKYAARYPFHKGMLHIQDVPGFEYIYIHTGNTDNHTSGCLLVGQMWDREGYTISASRYAYSRLYIAVLDAAIKGNLTITFEDNDREQINLPPDPRDSPPLGSPSSNKGNIL